MTYIRLFCSILICTALFACVTSKPDAQSSVSKTATRADSKDNQPVALKDFDQCAGNLHEFAGLFLMYYASHQKMPPTLKDVLSMADPAALPSLVCPASGQPYVYERRGYRRIGDERLLVLFDRQPAHNGSFQALLMSPPAPGQPLKTWVVSLPPLALQTYLASTPQ